MGGGGRKSPAPRRNNKLLALKIMGIWRRKGKEEWDYIKRLDHLSDGNLGRKKDEENTRSRLKDYWLQYVPTTRSKRNDRAKGGLIIGI